MGIMDAFYDHDSDCLAARKFATFKVITGEEYNSCEMTDKYNALAAIIYLLESQGINLGNYEITYTADNNGIELGGLAENIEAFQAWDIVLEIEKYLEEDVKFKKLTSNLLLLYLNSGLHLLMGEYFSLLAMAHYYIKEMRYSEEQALDIAIKNLRIDGDNSTRGLLLGNVKSFKR